MLEIEAFAVLTSIPHLGSMKIRGLIQKFGSALDALRAPLEEIKNIPGFDPILPYWTKWPQSVIWQNDLSLAEKFGTELIPFTSPLFPKSLLNIADHPALLYVQGQLKPQDLHSIAIVGTRHASLYGKEMAEQISKDLAAHGFTVISGLARGIDTAAHRGALARGRTVAVIGSGLADIYPPENQSLAQEISQKGALISEFSMATPPDRQNFPQRNRIVSGMSLATLLIEAPLKSGAMITMEKALSQKRKLLALPGRVDHENFHGNHFLIKKGKAQLVENAADVMAHFDTLFSFSEVQESQLQVFSLDKKEWDLLDSMPQEEVGIDHLVQLTHLPVQQIQTTLMSLILKKIVKEFPGKSYKKIDVPNRSKSMM